MFTTHTSNRLEFLLNRLDTFLSGLGSDIFARRTVIVQNQGMSRWLLLRLAELHGVCAGLDCPTPSAFIMRLVRVMERQREELSPYSSAAMVWAILDELLNISAKDKLFSPLAAYLAVDNLPARRFQLANRLARLFEQYMVFRPDWIRDWSAGREPDNWQAELWRRLLVRLGERHPIWQYDALLERLSRPLIKQAGVAGPVAIFGIPALPPWQLDFFARLSNYRDVHLFLLSPCRAHRLNELSGQRRIPIAAPDDIEPEAVNPLLASLGKTGREFWQQLAEQHVAEEKLYATITPNTLLAAIQADILDDRNASSLGLKGQYPQTADGSVRVHVVHSALREVEVLHDQLLDLLGSDPTLHPKDILVMAPNVGIYAPLVEMVFRAGGERERIPFSIADRSPAEGSPIIRAFLELLTLTDSRMPVSSVLGFLETPAVSGRFGIASQDCMRVRCWLGEAGIHWGLDAEQRERLGLAHSFRYTFRHGLDRLLLGFALPGDLSGSRFQGILPCGMVEGSAGDLLARLITFYEQLAVFTSESAKARTVSEWRDFLLASMENFFVSSPDNEDEFQIIRSSLDDIVQASQIAGIQNSVPLETLAEALSGKLGEQQASNAFLCGRVTFCQLAPMRSIPFRLIWLLGMNSGEFPRVDRPPAFDLMEQYPRPGDRSQREDDRYLFLETLLSARDCLCLSYIGVDQRDNSERPPSPVVSELLDYIASAFGPKDWKTVANLVISRHPLQPFSPRYFSSVPGLFTFNRDAAAAASSLASGGAPWPGMFAGQRQIPPLELPKQVSLDAFIRFFSHPARAFLKDRLGVFFTEAEEELADREVFSLDALGRYQLFKAIMTGNNGGESPEAFFAREEERGAMPEGLYGRAALADLMEEAEQMLSASAELREGGRLPDLELDLACNGVRLIGTLANRFAAGVVLGRPVKLDSRRLRDRVTHWVTHLVANSLASGGVTTYFVARDGTVFLPPLKNAGETLKQLADLYLLGMTQPLALLPESSLTYMRLCFPKKSAADNGPGEEQRARALDEASFRWLEGGFQQQPERLDPCLRLCFGDIDPVREQVTGPTSGFVEVTETVLRESWLSEAIF